MWSAVELRLHDHAYKLGAVEYNHFHPHHWQQTSGNELISQPFYNNIQWAWEYTECGFNRIFPTCLSDLMHELAYKAKKRKVASKYTYTKFPRMAAIWTGVIFLSFLTSVGTWASKRNSAIMLLPLCEATCNGVLPSESWVQQTLKCATKISISLINCITVKLKKDKVNRYGYICALAHTCMHSWK